VIFDAKRQLARQTLDERGQRPRRDAGNERGRTERMRELDCSGRGHGSLVVEPARADCNRPQAGCADDRGGAVSAVANVADPHLHCLEPEACDPLEGLFE